MLVPKSPRCWFMYLFLVWPSATGIHAQTTATDEAAEQVIAPDRDSRPGWYMGRQIAPTMSADGAEWLIRESRASEEAPQQLLRALQLRPGQHVCDFGCGNGYYSLQLAQRVGPKGRIYAVDIQQEMLDLLHERAQPRGIKNIQLLLATETDPKLPLGKLDLVLKELTANGFHLVGQYDELPWQHVLFFASEGSGESPRELKPWSPVVPVPTVSHSDEQRDQIPEE